MPGIENPLNFDFPESFETPRLRIGAAHLGDAAGLSAAVVASLEALKPWMPWAHNPQGIEDIEGVLRIWIANYTLRKDHLGMLIHLRETEEIIGVANVHHLDWSVPSFEIGYWLRTDMEGKGLMTEAVIGLTAFAFEHLRAERLEIRCDSRNHRSAAVALRAGYTLDATFRHESRDVDGELCDTQVFSRVRDV